MVLGQLFGNDKEEDIEEIDDEIGTIDRELQKIEGEKRTKALKKQKKQELEQKKRELKKEKLKQTKAGRVLSSIGEGLDKISADTEDRETRSQLQALSGGIEQLDGDGKNDSSAALGIGLDKPDKQDLEVEGDLIVEGNVEEGENPFEQENQFSSRTGELSENMEDIIR